MSVYKLSLRNTAPKGAIFYSLVMRYNQEERLFPVGALDVGKNIFLSCYQDKQCFKDFWVLATPEGQTEATA